MSLKDEIAQLRARIARDERALRLLEEAAKELDDSHRKEVLPNQHGQSSIIDTMDTETSVRGARLKSKHPGALKIRKVDGSVEKFADKHGLSATTVRSWYAKGIAARDIPRAWAEKLAKPPYSIPISAWRSIGD